MRAVDVDSEWTALLPGLLVGGMAIGVISPALAAAMVSVLPVERSGLDSVLVVAAATAFIAAVFAWPLLGRQRSTAP